VVTYLRFARIVTSKVDLRRIAATFDVPVDDRSVDVAVAIIEKYL
jgi:hypothetical protein